MTMLAGYKILEELHRGKNRVVYRARREADKKPVLIKTSPNAFAGAAEIASLKREHEILLHLRLDGVAKAHGLETRQTRLLLVLEDIGGEPLRRLIDSNQIDFATFLEVGIQLSNTLAALHQNNLIHKDVTPANIIVNLQNRRVQLIDFSIASRLPQESRNLSHPDLLEGTLAYMSPEQTGRMNRAMDYRTDFYSLGVTFYEMLTGRLPFHSADALELVHAHIAKIPPPPHELNPNVPPAISGIVMKLLAKTAEERYQSAYGLKADLDDCLAQWRRNGKIDGFIPGQKDFSERFQIPQKLFGREPELTILMSAFDRVSQGATEIMLVSGYSGIGKSALVNEVHKPIVRQRGYFIAGKFDQLKRNIPYSAVIQAFQELVRQLLTESETQIAAWKEKLLHALGANGQVIIGVIPEVELIIGGQPAVPELPPAESQNRFHLVFQRFIQVFAQSEHPLAVFLDDLQWADSATLKLLQTLITDPAIHCLFLIGAYRDNEVNASHPLQLALAEMEKAGAKPGNLTLQPLGMLHLNQLIAEALRCDTGEARPLADLVLRKTAGNPFFVTQFLKSLHQEKLLELNHQSGQWQFDLARIESQGMTDNVVELMAGKIQKLPPATQHVAKLAACIGNQFDLKTLAVVNEKPLRQTAEELWEAVREGLMVPIADFGFSLPEEDPAIHHPPSAIYKFLHDRVQQAAYTLIPDDRKKAVHLQVGRLMLQHSQDRELEEKLFDIVNHLNIGGELITDCDERLRLAELNLAAGRKARASAAFPTALNYFNQGLALLSPASWDGNYALTFTLHLEGAEGEYLCGQFDEAERHFDGLLEKAQTRLDKAKVYNLKILQYESASRYHDAIRVGREALAFFGLGYPERPEEKQAAVEAELAAIKALLGDRTIESLIALPAMTDPEIRAVMKLLTNLHTSCYLSADKFLTLVNTALMVRLSLAYGNVEESAYAYVLHAMHIGPIRGDYESAYEFGMLARRLSERYNDPGLRARVLMNLAWNVSLWRMPIENSIAVSRETFQLANDSGLFVEAAYTLFNDCWFHLLTTRDLEAFQKICAPNTDYIKRVKMHHFAMGAPQVILQWGAALQGRTKHPVSLTNANFDEDWFRANYPEDSIFAMFYFVAKLALLYTFDEHHAAHETAKKAERVIQDYTGTIWDALAVFYHALALAALHATSPVEARKDIEAQLETFNNRLKIWAENSPQNFQAQHLMVSAEIARVQAKNVEAMAFYEAAIEAATYHECLREGALANELYAKFWLQKKNEKIAALYMAEAHYGCQQWGAAAKAKDLEKKYPHLLPTRAAISALPPEAATLQHKVETLDLNAVIKAAQAISGEMELPQLLKKLMAIVIENAGAQKGVLMLERDGKPHIIAENTVEEKDKETVVLHATAVESSRILPLAIVNYVRRTGESLVLADAAGDDKFANDSYLSQRRPQSILCMPILHQGKLIGMLYLENNLTTGAFTPDRIEVMQILCAQAAISLENARLYDELELRVQERTLELSEANKLLTKEITERLRMEEALRAAKDAAEAANRAKSEFLARMSHELRTPLNSILGYAQIFQRDQSLTAPQQDGIATMQKSGEHLLSLINEILDLSKIEARQMELRTVDFNLPEFLQSLVEIFRVRAEQKGLKFIFEALSPLPVAVHGDAQRLRQVLINLLGNAVKFTEQGVVALKVGYRELSPGKTCMRFQVDDTGIGIAPENWDAIFLPFHQVSDDRHFVEGAGLGLTISRELVSMMGGELKLKSAPGAGSIFWVDLNLPEAVDWSAAASLERYIIGYKGAPRKILAVDDKKENRAIMVNLLAPLGFELKEAMDGRDGLNQAMAWRPDLILLDLVMPVMDGFEAIRRIRQIPTLKNVPVIALSANVFEHNRQQSLDAGCDDFIAKPVQAENLLNMLGRHLGLEWIYSEEEARQGREPKPEDATASLIGPPATEAAVFFDLAMRGDFKAILSRLESLEQLGEQYQPFAGELRRLAKEFRMKEIRDLLQPFME